MLSVLRGLRKSNPVLLEEFMEVNFDRVCQFEADISFLLLRIYKLNYELFNAHKKHSLVKSEASAVNSIIFPK